MRRIAVFVFRGLCVAALAMAVIAMPVFAESLPGEGDAVSVGDTAVTAQVIAEDTPPEEPSEIGASEDTAHSGATAGQVHTGDGGLWEPFFYLFVFSGIVLVALKQASSR